MNARSQGRRRFLGTAGALGLAGLTPRRVPAQRRGENVGGKAGTRPNFLFLLPDQHRADVVGAFGSTIVKTPAIDSLAATGVRFSRAYTTTALCSPARSSMMTGLYPHAHHIVRATRASSRAGFSTAATSCRRAARGECHRKPRSRLDRRSHRDVAVVRLSDRSNDEEAQTHAARGIARDSPAHHGIALPRTYDRVPSLGRQ